MPRRVPECPAACLWLGAGSRVHSFAECSSNRALSRDTQRAGAARPRHLTHYKSRNRLRGNCQHHPPQGEAHPGRLPWLLCSLR